MDTRSLTLFAGEGSRMPMSWPVGIVPGVMAACVAKLTLNKNAKQTQNLIHFLVFDSCSIIYPANYFYPISFAKVYEVPHFIF